MVTFLSVLQLIASVLIVISVLLQPAKSGGSTPFGGSSQSLLGNSGGTHLLFKVTMWCAAIIMISSLLIARNNIQSGRQSVVDTTSAQTPKAPVGGVVPVAPNVPVAPPAAPSK